MSVGGLLREARRLRAELETTAAARPSPTARRLAFAERLYAGHPEALARLLAAPDDPGRVLEYRLDRRLCYIEDGDPMVVWHAMISSMNIMASHGGFPDGAIRLRRLEIDMDPEVEPVVLEHKARGIVIPRHDLRWVPAEARARFTVQYRRSESCSILLPTDVIGEPLELYDERWPETWEEASWLAGASGDGLYLADHPDDGVTAIRATAGMVETRGFGEEWERVGANEES
jgi:hypothetical protein